MVSAAAQRVWCVILFTSHSIKLSAAGVLFHRGMCRGVLPVEAAASARFPCLTCTSSDIHV